MVYRVEYTAAALAELEEAYLWIARRAPREAALWFDAVTEAIESLADHPRRCPVAPEDEHFKSTIRHLVLGNRPASFRVLFEVRKGVVYVLHLRRSAQNLWTNPDRDDV